MEIPVLKNADIILILILGLTIDLKRESVFIGDRDVIAGSKM